MAITNQLTDKQFWLNYWESKQEIGKTKITGKFLFAKAVQEAVQKSETKSAIELGGFPGFFAIYLHKFLYVPTCLFDYVIHKSILENLLVNNNLEKNALTVIEGDLFKYTPDKKYDFVYSIGLIEHFKDIQNIIEKHMNFCSPNGTVFIVLPNFKSINGWINKTFDRSHFDAHNIDCMEKKVLLDAAEKAGLNQLKCYYNGKFSVWLEQNVKLNIFSRLFFKTIWLCGKVLTKIFPFESKALSPYIILEGKMANSSS